MIICGVTAVLVLLCVISGRSYEKELFSNRKNELPVFLLCAGLFLSDRIEAFRKAPGQGAMMERALLISRDEKRRQTARNVGITLFLILAGSIASMFMVWKEMHREDIYSLVRPAFGEISNQVLAVSGLQNDTELSVDVTGKVPAGEAFDSLFEEEFRLLLSVIPGKNESLDRVCADLDLPQETESGLRVIYRSSCPELLSSYGQVFSGELTQEGTDAVLTVTLVYGTESRDYSVKVHLVPETETEPSEKERLLNVIREIDEASSDAPELQLPSEFEGKTLRYRTKQTTPYVFLLTALLAAACLILLPGERMKEKMKKRDEELRRSYPGLLSKLGTLISAGMSIYGAWMRVVRDYEEGKEKGTRSFEYAYEEMRITANELRSGISEEHAYASFGKRCGQRQYIRFGNMLGQNVRQGISGFSETLRDEMSRALDERKNEALRQGETAGTRLLFPMLMMLGVVIISLIVPAFLSF